VGPLVREVGARGVAGSVWALADRIAGHREAARGTNPSMKLAALLVGLVLVTGCEKSGSDAKASGALSGAETGLLEHLPKGSVGLFGGNYMKFQSYLANSPLAKAMTLMEKSMPGMGEWMKCWVEEIPDLQMMGSIRLQAPTIMMQFVMKGLEISTLEKCTKKASFASTIDPDGKYLSYELPSINGPVKGGYLLLADGTIYSRQSMTMSGKPLAVPVSRAELEADIAALAAGNAQSDTILVDAMAKVDRSKAMWFVASGANTPISDKVGLIRGTFDIADGLAIDFTAEVKDHAIADKIEKTVGDAKDQADRLGGSIGEMIKAMKLTRSGDTLRFVLSINNKQLSELVQQLGPMMGLANRPN
jgi:hypothetical protein